eukprot:403331118
MSINTVLASTVGFQQLPSLSSLVYIVTIASIQNLDKTDNNKPDYISFGVAYPDGPYFRTDPYFLLRNTTIDVNEKFTCNKTLRISSFMNETSYDTSSFNCTEEGDFTFNQKSGTGASARNFRVSYNVQLAPLNNDYYRCISLKNLVALSNPQDGKSNDQLLVYVKSDVVGIQQLNTSYKDSYSLERYGLIAFKSASIPCNNYVQVFLREIDSTASSIATTVGNDDFTKKVNISCQDNGFQQVELRFSPTKDEKEATYSLSYEIAFAIPSYPQINNQSGQISKFEPTKLGNNTISAANRNINTIKFVKLSALSNFNGQNDKNSQDELTMFIYSDALNQMFTCGQYNVPRGGLVDFNGLEIPCKEQILLILSDKDSSNNDTFSVRIPCMMAGDGLFDFNIMANDSKAFASKSVKILDQLAEYNMDAEEKDGASAPFQFLTKFNYKTVASSNSEENDALYTIRATVFASPLAQTPYENEQLESNKTKCGASVVSPNQNNSVAASPAFQNYLPFQKVVALKYLISNNGKQDKANDDNIIINVYSDFYKRTISCGMYEMDNNMYLVLNDLEVPCNDELIITITEKDKTTNDTATLRLNCNNIQVGTLQFQLRSFSAQYVEPEAGDLNVYTDLNVQQQVKLSAQQENQVSYELRYEVGYSLLGDASRLNDKLCGWRFPQENTPKAAKALVNLDSLKYVVGKSKYPYVGATVFSDVVGETIMVFSNLNKILRGALVSINGGAQYVVACHDTLIVQLFNDDLSDVATTFIDCKQTQQSAKAYFNLGVQRVPYDMKFSYDMRHLIQTTYTDVVTGMVYSYLSISSLLQETSSLWNWAISNELYSNYQATEDYLQANYQNLTAVQKESADDRYWVRQYVLNYQVLVGDSSTKMIAKQSTGDSLVIDQSQNLASQVSNVAFYNKDQLLTLNENEEEDNGKKIGTYLAAALGSAIFAAGFTVLVIYLMRRYKASKLQTRVEILKASDQTDTTHMGPSNRSNITAQTLYNTQTINPTTKTNVTNGDRSSTNMVQDMTINELC